MVERQCSEARASVWRWFARIAIWGWGSAMCHATGGTLKGVYHLVLRKMEEEEERCSYLFRNTAFMYSAEGSKCGVKMREENPLRKEWALRIKNPFMD